ncbi:mucin-16-like [Diceros bicornis minor]|uniref:mucin-16-like n=1 Tax=Diceros bicornis minor TaxID=77932 RepID=UPI0026EEDA9D|nr:mucin-16-like [Diceros bicornis minor]
MYASPVNGGPGTATAGARVSLGAPPTLSLPETALATAPEPATTSLHTSSSPVPPEATTALGHNLKTLTVTFPISTLWYSSDRSNGSATFNSTERVLQSLGRPWSQQLLA